MPTSGKARLLMVYTYTRVGSRAKMMSASVARYLPTIISRSVTGLVLSHSIVPVLNSSAKERMVTAGTSNSNNHGAISKKRSSDA